MYEISFSEQSMHELHKLDILEQMPLIDALGDLSEADLKKGANSARNLGRFERDGRTLYRLRSEQYRVYFELQNGSEANEQRIHCYCILTQNSLTDVLFRLKLPVSEEQLFEQNEDFWRYIESMMK